ncbi:glycoside hydrolase family 88 protein [candidate division KSB1 bacterium]|nr:glycoside hydrolase family 88 protein [candidate division KSB1 bacterium]
MIIIMFGVQTVSAQDFPTQKQVLEKMTLANDYFMKKWPDPAIDIVTDRARPSNIWTRATYYEGLMALYKTDPKDTYYNYAVRWGEGHDWEPAYGGTRTTNADNQCCGQTYLELYQIDPQSKRLASIKATIDRMVNNNDNSHWWWIDALQMAMPASRSACKLAKFGFGLGFVISGIVVFPSVAKMMQTHELALNVGAMFVFGLLRAIDWLPVERFWKRWKKR